MGRFGGVCGTAGGSSSRGGRVGAKSTKPMGGGCGGLPKVHLVTRRSYTPGMQARQDLRYAGVSFDVHYISDETARLLGMDVVVVDGRPSETKRYEGLGGVKEFLRDYGGSDHAT